jgi:hypothetical protein
MAKASHEFNPLTEFLASFLARINRPPHPRFRAAAGDFLVTALERVAPSPKVRLYGPSDSVNERAPEQRAGTEYLASLQAKALAQIAADAKAEEDLNSLPN